MADILIIELKFKGKFGVKFLDFQLGTVLTCQVVVLTVESLVTSFC